MAVARVVKCVLLFQRWAAFLELIRGTHHGGAGRPTTILSVYFSYTLSFLVCSFVSIWKKKSVSFCYVPSSWVAIFAMPKNLRKKKREKKTFLTDWPTNRLRHCVATNGPAPSPEMPSALTVKQRTPVCHFAVWGGRWGRRSPTGPAWTRPPSHTVLSLFCYLLINQNQVSL